MRDTGPFSHLYWLHCSHEVLHFITFSMLHLFIRFLSTFSSNHSILKHPNLLKKSFIYQLMHKGTALKEILKFTLKQLRHVSV